MLLEKPTPTSSTEESNEAQAHNAQIQERYRQLQNAEAEQFSARSDTAFYESPIAQQSVSTQTFGSTPTVEQTPQVTEFVHGAQELLFTTKKFESVQGEAAEVVAPAFVSDVARMSDVVPTIQPKATANVSFGLNSVAKFSICAVAAVVVCLTSLIGVMNNAIKRVDGNLRALEQRKQELIEQNTEIERRIAEAKSDETIRRYAESQGMVQNG